MANFMGMTLARDVHLARVLGLDRPPRGRRLDGVRVYASDQAHFSIARALDELGFPPETLLLVPADERFRLHGAPVAAAIAADRAAGVHAVRDRGRGRIDEHRLGRPDRRAGRRRGSRGPLAPRRRGLRRRGAPVGPRRLAASPTSPGPTRSRSTRTSGSSRPTTSARWWSVAASSSWRRSTGARSTTAAAKAPPDARRRRPRGRPSRPGRRGRRRGGPAELLPALDGGLPTLAGAQAVVQLEAPRDRWPRPARRGEHRPRGIPGPTDRRVARLRGAAARARALGRLLPPPARRGGRGPPGSVRRSSTRTRIGSPTTSRRPATDGSGRPDCTARRGSGPGSSTTSPPRPISIGSSTTSGRSPAVRPSRRTRDR